VHGMPSFMEGAGLMSFAGAYGVTGWASGAGASATPPREGKLELVRSPTLH
jgi:hypothetical protein